jgi:hypothetical protein
MKNNPWRETIGGGHRQWRNQAKINRRTAFSRMLRAAHSATAQTTSSRAHARVAQHGVNA